MHGHKEAMHVPFFREGRLYKCREVASDGADLVKNEIHGPSGRFRPCIGRQVNGRRHN